MRFRTALVLGVAVTTFATFAAACSSFGTTSEPTDSTASPDAATEGNAIEGGVPIGDASAEGGPGTVCSKPVLVDPFTTIDPAWEKVGGGTFTPLPAGNPMRQAVVMSVDLASNGQEAYLQRYVPLPTPPTSVRLQYGYYAGGNTAGSASVGCRLEFVAPAATSELLIYHPNGKSTVRLESAVGSSVGAGIDTFPYENSATATGVEWHDVDLRVDITGTAGAVTLAGYDTTLLGHLSIPSDLTHVRLRCGAALLDYGAGILGVGISKLELDVCP